MFDDHMYHCGAGYLLEQVRNQDDKYETIMLFGHNPGFNDFADLLLDHNPVYNIPTAGIYKIRFHVNRWKKIKEGNGEIVFFDYPRRYEDEWH